MIHHVMVVGYGIMGQGIALSFARGGHQVTVLSRNPSRIDALPDGILAVAELPADPPDLIIEAIPERRELKIFIVCPFGEGLWRSTHSGNQHLRSVIGGSGC